MFYNFLAIKKSALISNPNISNMSKIEQLNEREMRYSIKNYHDDPNEDANQTVSFLILGVML